MAVVLVDGSSYLYRAYHALPPLTSPAGQPAGALYGVLNMLRKVQRDYAAEYMLVILDSPGTTFRHTLYPAYKAHRPSMPADLREQWNALLTALPLMGIPFMRHTGVEADDLIAGWTHWVVGQQQPVCIISGDKDLLQLVSPTVTIVDTLSRKQYDSAAVQQKWGVLPDKIPDFLALVGDQADNIPGIPGVGPKTAAKWLQQYASLEGIVAAADEITGKVGENLRAHLSQLSLAKQLVTLQRDCISDPQWAALTVHPPMQPDWADWLRDWGFHSILKEYTPVVSLAAVAAPVTWEEATHWVWATAVNTEGEATQWCYPVYYAAEDSSQSRIGVPVQIDAWRSDCVQLSRIYANRRPTLVVHDAKTWMQLPQSAQWLCVFPEKKWPTAENAWEDTRILDHVLHNIPTPPSPESWVDVAKRLAVPADHADDYPQLFFRLQDKIRLQSGLEQVYREIELPLIPILYQMEQCGVSLNTQVLHEQSAEIGDCIASNREHIAQLAGVACNIDSTKQLRELLFVHLAYPVTERTPKGEPSTNEKALQLLAADYPIAEYLLVHRSLSKLKSTYLDKLPGCVDAATGRLHAHFDQCGTVTGRFSCSDPNLQNIPVRTPAGRKIRDAFVAPQGWCILSCDYSQIELRIMAHLSRDPALLKAFANRVDVHQQTAAEVFGVPLDAVTGSQRRAAKAINFGLIYGMSAFGLAAQLGVDRAEAQRYLETYFARYPGVKAYMEQTEQAAQDKGYVETVFGRRLYLPQLRSPHPQQRRAALRAAINAPMQGTAADIIKKAMIAIHPLMREDSARLLMQVHDELVFEIREDVLVDFQPMLVHTMQHAVALSVPLEVSSGAGPHWGAAH